MTFWPRLYSIIPGFDSVKRKQSENKTLMDKEMLLVGLESANQPSELSRNTSSASESLLSLSNYWEMKNKVILQNGNKFEITI